MKIAAALALLIATSAISVEAYGLNRGPHSYAQGVTPGSGLTVGSREFDRRYKAYRIMKATGYSLLGSGFGIVIAGVGLVEASAFGPVGMAGFIAIGVGLVHFIASAFLLGLSRTLDTILVPPKNAIQARPTPTRSKSVYGVKPSCCLARKAIFFN